ncbi:MAG TPA: MFS transporter [Dermatophilaceae bacterium]|nr:MFS transporter [Dermatophilaceae bacterium]
MTTRQAQPTAGSPPRAGLVLVALILAAAVANLNLAVANVALPTIGTSFDASQTELNLIAVGYSLGLAASVLYLGAVGDRYGRKLMLLLGSALSLPLAFLAAYAPNTDVLIGARILGGVAGGMCYPTTLALIAALWSGPTRTKSIALWSAIGAAVASLGPLLSGTLLEHFWWGSVFLVTVPVAVAAFLLAWFVVPAHVSETTKAVDNVGGILSIAVVGALILAINFAVVPNAGTLVLSLVIVVVATLIAFVIRQRRAANPLYDLKVAARPTFWVAAVAGIIVFGSLMGAMFIGQQFLQNVLGYSTVQAGAAVLPAAVMMILVAPRSAKLVGTIGSRMTLLIGYVFVLLGFVTMLLLWHEGSAYWQVGVGYAFVGIGVGFAQTPAAHSLTGSVPPTRVGMASGTADLQRDLGGALMQSIFGALLAAGYASAMTSAIGSSDQAASVNQATQSELTKSFSSAAATAARYPQDASAITAAAKQSFLQGDHWAYSAGIVAVLIGAAVVFFYFPKADKEHKLVAGYHEADGSAPAAKPVAA